MHDGIAFEKAGKPATTVLTDNFLPLAQTKRHMMGHEDYQYVTVPHPLRDPADVHAKAQQCAQDVVKALTRT